MCHFLQYHGVAGRNAQKVFRAVNRHFMPGNSAINVRGKDLLKAEQFSSSCHRHCLLSFAA